MRVGVFNAGIARDSTILVSRPGQPLDFDADEANVVEEILRPENCGPGQDAVEQGFPALTGAILDQGEKPGVVRREVLIFAEIAEAVGVKEEKIARLDHVFLGGIDGIFATPSAKGCCFMMSPMVRTVCFVRQIWSGCGMAGVGEPDHAGDGIDDHVEGGDEHGGRQRFEEVMQPPVEFAEKCARVVRETWISSTRTRCDRSHQRGMDAVAHDIADEDAGLGVRDWE